MNRDYLVIQPLCKNLENSLRIVMILKMTLNYSMDKLSNYK